MLPKVNPLNYQFIIQLLYSSWIVQKTIATFILLKSLYLIT